MGHHIGEAHIFLHATNEATADAIEAGVWDLATRLAVNVPHGDPWNATATHVEIRIVLFGRRGGELCLVLPPGDVPSAHRVASTVFLHLLRQALLLVLNVP